MTKIPAKGLPIRNFGALRYLAVAPLLNVTQQSRNISNGSKPVLLVKSTATVDNVSNCSQRIRFYSSSYPEHKRVNLPALSPTMEMGTVVSWQKKIGDQLSEGDLLCEIETDKATMGFETPDEGYLAKIVIPEGTKDVPIGKLLCIIVENEKDVAAFNNFVDEDGGESKPKAKETEPQTDEKKTKPAESKPPAFIPSSSHPLANGKPSTPDRISATPFARKIAIEKKIDLTEVSGSGPNGRILAADLHNASKIGKKGASDSQEFTDVPLTNMRKTIAKRLTESKSTIPHYYLTSEINLENLIQIRERLNNLISKPGNPSCTKLSINDFVVKASALACVRVPECNSFFMDSFIRKNNNVDVCVAVSTPAGLITPIISNAHIKGLATISSEISELAVKARDGKLQPHEYQGGTFTVSNLGMFKSVTDFTAIINPPQSCILAVGGAEEKVIPDQQDGYRVITAMKVTLSCDHRTVDGAVGAVWLRHFKEFLEKPHTMLL